MTRVTNEEMADMMRADIAALKAENARLRAALLPFARVHGEKMTLQFTFGDVLRAQAALTPHSTESYPTPPRATEEEG